MNPTKLDHVAYWFADRDPVAEFLSTYLGMHVIDRTETFTLVGSNARRGKLTLFDADGPRERGALEHVALRVSNLEAALDELPSGLEVDRPRPGEAYFDVGGEGVRLGLVEAGTDVEVDNVVDAANTYAVFLWGPERVRVEYVEHKPTFSLR